MVRRNSKTKGDYMKKIFVISILFINLLLSPVYSKSDLYEKIDLFGEVLEKIKYLNLKLKIQTFT